HLFVHAAVGFSDLLVRAWPRAHCFQRVGLSNFISITLLSFLRCEWTLLAPSALELQRALAAPVYSILLELTIPYSPSAFYRRRTNYDYATPRARHRARLNFSGTPYIMVS